MVLKKPERIDMPQNQTNQLINQNYIFTLPLFIGKFGTRSFFKIGIHILWIQKVQLSKEMCPVSVNNFFKVK